MELAPISPYGLKILEEKIETISWGNTETKSILFHSLVSELIRQKSAIYLAYDEGDPLVEPLSDLSISADQSDFKEQLYQFIKSSMESDEADNTIRTYDFTRTYQWETARSFGNPFWGGRNLSWLMESFRESSSKISADELLAVLKGYQYEYTYKEYSEILLAVEEAVQMYEASFHFLDENNLFNDSVFINKEGEFSTSVLLKYLSNFHSKAYVLSKSYSQFFGKVSKEQAEKAQRSIRNIKIKIRDLQSVFQQIPTQKMSKAAYAKWTEKCNALKKEMNQVFNLDLAFAKMYDEKDIIEQTLQSLSKLVHAETAKIEFKIRDYIKSINVKSHPDVLISKIEKEINQLYKSINSSQIFEHQLENNSISSYKQFHQLKSLATTIVTAQNQLMNMGNYYNWKAFLVQLPEAFRNVIIALKSIKKGRWLAAFQSWYFYKVIEKNRPLDAHQKNPLKTPIYTQILQDQITITRKHALLKLREETPKLYNKILKKSANYAFDPENNYHIAVLDAFSIFKKADHSDSYPDNSTLIDLTRNGFDSEHMSSYRFETKSSAIYEQNHFPFAQFVSGKLAAIDINEKLDVAKFLSGYFEKKLDRLELYLSKKANLILHVSDWKKRLILQEIDLEGLKKIRLKAPFNNGITEYMLNHSENMYYVYDDFYESQQNIWDHYRENQYLEALRKAGYQTIFLDSNNLMEREDSYIDQLSKLTL